MSGAAVAARRQERCYVCGQENERGLRVRFATSEAGWSEAEWRPGEELEGFAGIVHGGVVSTVLDEAMSKAVAAMGTEALTAELRVRYRRPVESGQRYRVRGWVAEKTKRLVETEAVVETEEGAECARGWASFLALKKRRSDED